METAVNNCPIKEEQQLFDDVDRKIDVINSLKNDLSSQPSMPLSISKKVAKKEVGPEWIEPIKVACCNTEKYECSRSIGGVYCNRMLTQSYVEKILFESGVYLKELSLSKTCNSSIMPIVAEHCKNLTKLEFVHDGDLKMNTNDYVEAFTKLKKLKFIKIKLIHMDWCHRRKFPYEAISYLPEEMNEIHLIHEQGLSKKAVFFDLKRFKNLHSLTLSSCTLNEILQAISEKTTLIYLDLINFRVTRNCSFNIGDIFNELVNLEHIGITINKLTSNVPTCILNTCKKIRYLELPSCNNWKQPKISIEKWGYLKNLEHLTITWEITNEIAIKLVKYCKKLKYLDISRIVIITQTALRELTKLKNLECLKVGEIFSPYAKTIIAISINCKKLKILRIYRLFNSISFDLAQPLRPSVLEHLLKLRYLEQLDLTWVFINEFQATNFIANIDICKNLTKLDITGCRYFNESTLIALANSKSFKELKVAYGFNVTDNFISKLKGLQCFDCTGCKKITDAGVIQLINNCPDLENLNLRRTYITIDTIIGASKATKNRINNIILAIDVEWILREPFKKLNKSIWLALVHFHGNIRL